MPDVSTDLSGRATAEHAGAAPAARRDSAGAPARRARAEVPTAAAGGRRSAKARRDDRAKLWRTSPLRPVRLHHFVALLIVLGLGWRTTRYVLNFPAWDDECFVGVNFIDRGFADMVGPLVYGQIVPLGFMWLNEAVSRVLGFSELALRLLPYVAGLVSLLAFWRFAGDVLPRRAAFLAIGFFAAAYYTVRHAAEIKPYATDLLVSLTLTMLAWSVYRRPGSAWRWAALTAWGALAVWCSYPAIFVAGAAGLLLALGAWRGRLDAAGSDAQGGRSWGAAPIAAVLAYGVAACGSFAAMYLIHGKPQAEYGSKLTEIDMWALTFPPIVEFWKFPLWFYHMHLGRMLAYPIGGNAPASAVAFALVVIGAVHLWRGGRRDLLLLLLGPLGLAFLAAALHLYPYGGSARTTQYLAPAFCLLAGLGLFTTLRHFFRGPRLAVSVRLAGVFFAAVAIGGMVRDGIQPFKSEHEYTARQAIVSLAQRSGPNDRWVVYNAPEKVDYAPWLGDWRGEGAQFVFDSLRYCPGGPHALVWSPPPESLRFDGPGAVWLLVHRPVKVPFPEQQFEAYMAAAQRALGTPAAFERVEIRKRKGRTESIDAYVFRPAQAG